MSLSTPLNMIRNNQSQQNQMHEPTDTQLVEDILKEMGNSDNPEIQSNINSNTLQYAMDQAQIPPHKYQQQQEPYMNMNPNSGNMNSSSMNSNTLLGDLSFNLNTETIRDKFIRLGKYPVLIFILSFMISLPEFNRFIFGFFPSLLLESGQISLSGVFLKAILVTVAFCIIAMFI